MTEKQAIELYKSNFWKEMTQKDIAVFQMNEDRLCMPFDVFHKAMEKTLGRPVWTHEFGLNREGLKKELMGESPSPSQEDIINMIPEDKRIIVVTELSDFWNE